MSAYSTLKSTLEGLIPATWSLTAYEPSQELPDATTLTMKIRTVTRLPAAPQGAYQVAWILTVTSPYPSRETADPQLFDDLIDFLAALDSDPSLSWLAWTEATKTVGDDLDRLAYDITVIHNTTKEEA